MYGSVGRIQIKPGRVSDLKRYIQGVDGKPGVLAMTLVGKDGSTSDYCWIIVWSDKVAHDAFGGRAEFPAEYQHLLELSAKDPDWHSGEIVFATREKEEIHG